MKSPHPDSQVFPAMVDEEFAQLADDIEANGLLEPIVLLDGQVLDGRHRDRACEERGVKPRYVDWDALCGITPLEWVVSKNLHRRQLTHGQRTALAVELQDRLGVAARARQLEALNRGRNQVAPLSGQPDSFYRSRRSDVIAGKTFGVGHSSVTILKQVAQTAPDLFDDVKAGRISVGTARRNAGLVRSGKPPVGRPKADLKNALAPLHRYLRKWDETRLRGTTPTEARRLLKVVQEIDHQLFEVERALEERTVVSRALR